MLYSQIFFDDLSILKVKLCRSVVLLDAGQYPVNVRRSLVVHPRPLTARGRACDTPVSHSYQCPPRVFSVHADHWTTRQLFFLKFVWYNNLTLKNWGLGFKAIRQNRKTIIYQDFTNQICLSAPWVYFTRSCYHKFKTKIKNTCQKIFFQNSVVLSIFIGIQITSSIVAISQKYN